MGLSLMEKMAIGKKKLEEKKQAEAKAKETEMKVEKPEK